LVQRQTVERVNRVPGLSRIPLAGKLFQTVDKLEQDVEVAIFISPRIIQPETTNIECR
jgi:type II secretory pathway component GspD/PulD (secretin)